MTQSNLYNQYLSKRTMTPNQREQRRVGDYWYRGYSQAQDRSGYTTWLETTVNHIVGDVNASGLWEDQRQVCL